MKCHDDMHLPAKKARSEGGRSALPPLARCEGRQKRSHRGCWSPSRGWQRAGRWPKAGVVTAMMDKSDGLALSLSDLAEVSHVGFVVQEEALPLAEGLAEMVGQEKALEMAMSAGGDFELVFTVRPDGLEAARQRVRADGDRRGGGGGNLDGARRREETGGGAGGERIRHRIGGCKLESE